MAAQETTLVKGKTGKKMERIIAYFKNHVFLSKFSKMDTNQDRAVKKVTRILSFSLKTA